MKLHDYQRLAVSFLQKNPKAGLFLDLGLGKTATVLSALTPEHLPALVVAPKRVAENTWPEERDLWRPDLSMALAAGGPAARAEALRSGADIVVLGRDNLKDTAPVRDRFTTLVLDELSGFKSKGSTRWKVANALSQRVDHVWGLTGTPSPNGYLDLFPQIMLLDRGKRLGTRITSYRERFFYAGNRLPNGIVTEWIMHEGADAKIKALLEDLCLYMDAEGRIKIPPVSYPAHTIHLPPDVMAFYRRLKYDMVASMDDLGLVVSADSAGVLSNRLSQVSAGFIYDVDQETGERTGTTTTLHSERIEMVKELLEAATSPVLVAYRYKEEERLLLQLPGARSIREKGVIQDWNKGDVPILVAHPASAGHGLNLQHGGHTIIWTSPNWELELWIQFNGRLNRQGQKHPVVVHKIIAKDTVDKIIYNRLETKDSVQQDLLDHLRSPV